MNENIIDILNKGRKLLQGDLADLDASIVCIEATITHGNPHDNPSVQILMKGRESLQAQLDELERTVANIEEILAGKVPSKGDPVNRPPASEQYAGMKLSTAVQAYLAERGRGPIPLRTIVEHLRIGGMQHGRHRRDPEISDLRLLATNNKKRFLRDKVNETLTLRTAVGNDTGRISPNRVNVSQHAGQPA